MKAVPKNRKRVAASTASILLAVIFCLLAACSTGNIETSGSAGISSAANGTASETSASDQTAEVAEIDAPSDVPASLGNGWEAQSGGLFYTNSATPDFTEYEGNATNSFETYSKLDKLGRCGEAVASVGLDIMPTGGRGNISKVKPSGWRQAKYDFINGGVLYNRCHLLAHSLTGEDANRENLITGTRQMNEAMIQFENIVYTYVTGSGNHVLYRVTPVFEGRELVARGVLMEGLSVEDDGKRVNFNVFIPNKQKGVEIDYATGESWLAEQ